MSYLKLPKVLYFYLDRRYCHQTGHCHTYDTWRHTAAPLDFGLEHNTSHSTSVSLYLAHHHQKGLSYTYDMWMHTVAWPTWESNIIPPTVLLFNFTLSTTTTTRRDSVTHMTRGGTQQNGRFGSRTYVYLQHEDVTVGLEILTVWILTRQGLGR